MLRLRCLCGKSLKLPAEHAGKLASCPACKRKVRIVATDRRPTEKNLKGLLVIQQGPHRVGEQIFLGGAKAIAVGKADDAVLRLAGSGVSRRHCQLLPSSRGWRIEDHGSTNGLHINGRRVKAHNLLNGDCVTIGDYELRYTYEPAKPRRGQNPDPWPSADATAIPEDHASTDDRGDHNLHFLDDAAALSATGAAPFIAAAVRPPPPVSEAAANESAFELAIEGGEAGPPISLPIELMAGADGFRECPECQNQLPPAAMICIQCGYDLRSGQRLQTFGDTILAAVASRSRVAGEGGSLTAYFKDCLWTLALILRFGNLLKFGVLATAVVLAAMLFTVALAASHCFLMAFAIVAVVAMLGWASAYLFSVVEAGAAGDEDLPPLSAGDGLWDSGVVPFFKMLGVTALVHVPVLAYVLVVQPSMASVTQGDHMVLNVLLWLRSLIWPFALLIAALGGMECFFRPDLIFKTIARSFLPYLAVCGMSALAFEAFNFVAQAAAANSTIFGGSVFATTAVLLVIAVACTVIAMRCIGLYYHHFKDRFAWSWG